jgi:hypothetical protein
VSKYDDLLNAVYGSEGRPLSFELKRGAETVPVTVTP